MRREPVKIKADREILIITTTRMEVSAWLELLSVASWLVVVMKYNVISTRLTGGCLVLVVNVMTVMWPDSLTYDPRGISGGWVGFHMIARSPWSLHCHIICNAATASRTSNPRLEETQIIKDYF